MSRYSRDPVPKVFITGDSWGCGEWNYLNQQPKILHLGLEQYFNDSGYQVINVSKGKSSNSESIDRLATALEKNFNSSDIIFYIKTDPARDLIYDKNFINDLEKYNTYQEVLINESNKTYSSLDALAKKFNTSIYLIGGVCSIGNTDKFLNLVNLVPSFIYLLVGHMPEYQHFKNECCVVDVPVAIVARLKELYYNKQLAEDLINEWYDISMNVIVLKELIFCPDGVHPNRHGHKILFDEIVKKLNL
jgi:hypothetical protein